MQHVRLFLVTILFCGLLLPFALAGCGSDTTQDCIPVCANRECGGDGCGGSCGSCLTGETCAAGVCQGGTTCHDQDQDSYFEETGCGTLQDCDDGNADVNPGATEGPENDPTCQDTHDNDCDGDTDQADSGCQSEPECTNAIDCNDQNPCTNDVCASGVCQNPNNTNQCDDGDPCTTGDTCSGGVCSGSLLDEDSDGYASQACGGTDCNDENASIHPGVAEICEDEIDQDCDGSDLECFTVTAGTWFGEARENGSLIAWVRFETDGEVIKNLELNARKCGWYNRHGQIELIKNYYVYISENEPHRHFFSFSGRFTGSTTFQGWFSYSKQSGQACRVGVDITLTPSD